MIYVFVALLVLTLYKEFILPGEAILSFQDKLTYKLALNQLMVAIVIWWFALYISLKQLNLAKNQSETVNEQTKLMNRQLEFMAYSYNVNKAEYELNSLTNNLDTNLLQYITWTIIKYLDKDDAVSKDMKEKLEHIDVWIWVVNKTVDEAIKNYWLALNDKPERLQFKKKEEE